MYNRQLLPINSSGKRIPVGEARTTAAGKLGSKFVIHAVGPRYATRASASFATRKEEHPDVVWTEDGLLAKAYAAALQEARDHKCRTVAFSLLSAGHFRGGRALNDVLRIGCEILRLQAQLCADAGIRQLHMVGFTHVEIETLIDAAQAAGWVFSKRPILPK
eukprot:SAG31_NODE_6711_length_1916_cov_1.727573_2_plen_162_part_00